jgi:DNA-directed RNA polymerase subunit RPC12/RpoP
MDLLKYNYILKGDFIIFKKLKEKSISQNATISLCKICKEKIIIKKEKKIIFDNYGLKFEKFEFICKDCVKEFKKLKLIIEEKK